MTPEPYTTRHLNEMSRLKRIWDAALADGRLTPTEARVLQRRINNATSNAETLDNVRRASHHVENTGRLPRDYQVGLWLELPEDRDDDWPTDRPAA